MEKKKKDYTGFPGDLHEDHIKALDEFREYVKQQFLYEEGNKAVGQSQSVVDDTYLLRFLRARKFDVKKTIEMWNDSIKWRQENKIDTILKDYEFTELREVREYYPHGYHKTDKEGRPIYIERIGSLQLTQLFNITSEERLIKYYAQSYEVLLSRIFPACSVAVGKRVDQTFSIIDLKGAPMKMMSSTVYNFIKLASKIAQDNYPEILGKMFIINAPMLFTGVWQVIKPWLDEKTKKKITIIGGKYQDKLKEFIDEENLPDFLGGKSPCDAQGLLSQNIGVWNPNGDKPLYPGEQGFDDSLYGSQQDLEVLQKAQQNKEETKDDDEEEDENKQQDLDQLKNALLNMGVGQQNVQKAPFNPAKDQNLTTNQNHIVSATPLNTQNNEETEGDQQINFYN